MHQYRQQQYKWNKNYQIIYNPKRGVFNTVLYTQVCQSRKQIKNISTRKLARYRLKMADFWTGEFYEVFRVGACKLSQHFKGKVALQYIQDFF